MVKLSLLFILFLPSLASGSHWDTAPSHVNNPWISYASLITFMTVILVVVFEEFIHLRKSKPMLLSASLI